MNYLVTGGAGFIGSHIVEELLSKGHAVSILDDFSAGNMMNVQNTNEINIINASVTDLSILNKICGETQFDGIFHLAAVASVQKSIDNPRYINEVNAVGTLNILDIARKYGIRKVVLSASAAAYGNNPLSPKKESMIPEPLSPYAVSKITAEMYCKVYSELYDLETVSLRYFNVFGPRQNPNGEYAAVIPKFIESILGDKPLTIYGDGEQTRDFVYVKDIVQANLLAMNSHVSGLFNVGTGKETSLNFLADLIMNLSGNVVDINYVHRRDGDVKFSVADIEKAKSVLGYSPKFSLKEGIVDYLSYIIDNESSQRFK